MSISLTKCDAHPGKAAAVERNRLTGSFSPRFDVWETDDGLTLYGDLPGVTPENLDIHFEHTELTIHGRVEPRQTDTDYLYSEYGVGDFYRTFTIGETIDTERVTAELRDGVLTVQLPKSAAVKPRRIEVQGVV